MEIETFPKQLFEQYKPEIIDMLVDIFQQNQIAEGAQAKSLAIKKAEDLGLFIEDGSAILIGAFDVHALAGFAWLYPYQFCGTKRLHLTEFAVADQYRGRGIAGEMLQRAESIAAQMGICEIDLYTAPNNQAAIHAYEKRGFFAARIHFVKEVNKKDECHNV